ncbi:DEAD/DEAH box helicase [Corynebacterium poyangense]|uniref:DEAD/DEAH box helicase n=1 Tax=Corynebacterium poyangense TaxID=2684405 RepID=A0A7H0SNU1_9CORY|nr:DEAD/DEAH box helicase [Corynebacterium poyangense]MBZ8177769.1 DEAD/DEAH box helicase [Corynebacterium poyangense]QNQ90216.1 DEAD/DEAH box helicase [Corynebacterium poyangense]
MSSFLAEFSQSLSFPLDHFQKDACRHIESGEGVLLCAPTGAGKTIVGEFAVALALSQGTKCFYTTPIKALSNQKFHDFQEHYGPETVGLLTGDVTVNPDADIVVMTTEVLRNMIYSQSLRLDRLSHVVMDEIHYLADRSRGPVWEEIILNLPADISIIGLSATVSNSEEFGRWLSEVRGDTAVIVTEHRPVPLNQWMMVGSTLYPLFDPSYDTKPPLNPKLLTAIERREQRSQRRAIIGRPQAIDSLQKRSMLPAIFFIFSRSGCGAALHQCLRSHLTLTTQEEAEEIGRLVDTGVADIPIEDLEVLDFPRWRAALTRGCAAHHAGMLPAFRHIVEELFSRGLLKVVFATETLALGINMPARTVVLERLIKFNGEAHVDLTPGEYTQLTGRAGRRGIDQVGHAVVHWAPTLDPEAVAGLASTRTYPLNSTFTPGYNMTVNLLSTRSYEDSISLIEQSFAQFQAHGSIVGDARSITRLEEQLSGLEHQLDQELEQRRPALGPEDDAANLLVEYMKIRRDLTEAEKDHRRRGVMEREKEVRAVLARLGYGEVIAMPGKKRPVMAVVVKPAQRPQDPRPMVITETGWCGRIKVAEFANPPVAVGQMKLPRGMAQPGRKNTRYVMDNFRRHSYGRPKKLRQRARIKPSSKIIDLRQQLRDHPVHQWPANDREYLARTAARVVETRTEISRRKRRISGATDTLARTFEQITALLTELGYLTIQDGQPVVTEEGQRLAQLHHPADLLIAQCLRSGIWDNLDPAELAGIAALCTFENRQDLSSDTEVPTEALATAMNATESLWSELINSEQRHHLDMTRLLEPGFSTAIHQWTAGAPLDYCLAAAHASGAELSPGDFVRWCRQVVDLLRQIENTSTYEPLQLHARQAIQAIQRGVVTLDP